MEDQANTNHDDVTGRLNRLEQSVLALNDGRFDSNVYRKIICQHVEGNVYGRVRNLLLAVTLIMGRRYIDV